MAEVEYLKRLSMGQSVTISGLKRSYLTKREEKEMFTILCGTEIELGRDQEGEGALDGQRTRCVHARLPQSELRGPVVDDGDAQEEVPARSPLHPRMLRTAVQH